MIARYPLKGIFKVRAKGHVYYYAWRGPPLGPRLVGEPGSPEFHASYVEAHANLRAPDNDRFRSLVVAYRASADFTKLAPATMKSWNPWLDRIGKHFGELRIAQFERTTKIRPIIIGWRNQWADKPRTADYAVQVLSRVLAHAVDLGKIAGNPCEGIKHLYHDNSRSEIIWADFQIDAIKRVCSPEIGYAVDLAAHTGLRLGDLLRLSWSNIEDHAIVITTGKSRHQREAVIPLYDALREVLARIPKRSTVILTNRRGIPWTRDGFGSSFNKAKIAVGFSDQDLHFHDLRGTAATKFYLAGLSDRAIAEIMGWSEIQVSRIIQRYVSRTATLKSIIAQLNKGTK